MTFNPFSSEFSLSSRLSDLSDTHDLGLNITVTSQHALYVNVLTVPARPATVEHVGVRAGHTRLVNYTGFENTVIHYGR